MSSSMPTQIHMYMYIYIYIHVNLIDEEGRSKQGHTNNKAKQHSTPKAVTFPKKNELPRVGLEPTTLYTLERSTSYTCTPPCRIKRRSDKSQYHSDDGYTSDPGPPLHDDPLPSIDMVTL